jgi:hypothetical protein
MKSRRGQVMLIGVAVLALSAGVAAGLLAGRLPGTDESNIIPAIDRTPLVEELRLDAQQRQQMQAIWEGVREEVRRAYLQAQELQNRRDGALVALLNDEQKAKFALISQDYAERFAELSKRRDQSFQDAVDQTNKLLDEQQRATYKRIIERHVAAVVPAGSGSSIELAPNPRNR